MPCRAASLPSESSWTLASALARRSRRDLYLLNHTDALLGLGFPILVGTSRKSFIGYTLDAPPEDRLEGTAATVALAIARGAHIVRVHDVRAMARVARMTDAILRATP